MLSRRVGMLFQSIRGRLILLAAAILVPSALLAALLVAEAHRGERAVVERQLSETARALSLVVDRQLGQSEVMLRTLATSPYLERSDLDAFRRQAEQVIGDRSQWIVLAGRNGRQLLNTAVPPTEPLAELVLPPGLDSTLQLGQTYISNLLPRTQGPGHVLSVAIPLQGGEPEHYALGLVMRPSVLSDVLADQDVPNSWIAAIIDRNGTIVARTRRAEEFVGGKATPDIRRLIRTTSSGIVESVTLDGVPTLAAYNRSPTFGWTVIIGAPKSELHASAKRLLLLALIVSVLLVAIGIGTYVWAARGVVRSVEILVNRAAAVGRGQVPELASTGIRETDHVADALHHAAVRLHARETDLKRLNETLEARVKARTREHARVNHELSILNRELQDFAYVASHDLQEPLRKVQSFANLLENDHAEALGTEGRDYLARMQSAAERMSALIKGLLDFSRVKTQTQPAVPVDLNEVLTTVTSDLGVRVEEEDGRIEIEGRAVVEADPVQIYQLLLNLIGNALKFRRPDVPPVVRVHIEEDGDAVRIVVEDNGIGFEEQYAERIFMPFHRLHGRSSFEGTGMGLAIVRRIAERHGGTVKATSTPGEGSRFVVTLPAKQPAPKQDQQELPITT